MLIDIHGHIGRIVKDRNEAIGADDLIAKMDAWGVDITCVLALSEHPEGAYMDADTEDVLKACAAYPDRLIPFCLIDPRFGNRPEMDLSYLFEEYAEKGCRGVGELLPKMDFDDPRCMNLYKHAGRYGMPVLFDMMNTEIYYGLCDSKGMPRLENALSSFPETVFIGHGPSFWAEISGEGPYDGYPSGPVKPGGGVQKLMRKYPNLRADLSARSGCNALTRDPAHAVEFLDEFNYRLIFGTDSCLKSDVSKIPPIIKFLDELESRAALSAEAFERIRHKNCRELLKI